MTSGPALGALLHTQSVPGTPIFIPNPSFELPALADGGFIKGAPDDWETAVPIGDPVRGLGTLRPTASDLPNGPHDGLNVLTCWGDVSNVWSPDLIETEIGRTYTMTGQAMQRPTLEGGTLHAGILIGLDEVESVSGVTPSVTEWTPITLIYVADVVGQLGVVVGAHTSASSMQQILWDSIEISVQ